MYKIYVDKGFINKDKIWKKTGESADVELVIYDGFSNLILKLDAEDKNIVYLYDGTFPGTLRK